MLRVLNLYSGLGGNRRNWRDCKVTAVEMDARIAGVYAANFPDDEIIVGDAHAALLERYDQFDFIWSSPPCQTHSRMSKATRHDLRRYTDLALYEEIMLLRDRCKAPWVVENVKPYYSPLIEPTVLVGRHLFWCGNFQPGAIEDVPRPAYFINRCTVDGSRMMKEWLGISYEGNIYYGKNHCPAQVLRNCVHPRIGEQFFTYARTNHLP